MGKEGEGMMGGKRRGWDGIEEEDRRGIRKEGMEE